jgi:DNA-binding response OmpR family regulator
LVVEDDARLATLVRQYFEDEGFAAAVETDGARAVGRVLAAPPDVLLLDWMLPGEDGPSICRRLRGKYDGVIVMVTARAEEVDEVVALEVGADDYVSKPLRPRALAARVRSHLRRGRGEGAAGEAGPIVAGDVVVCARSRTARRAGRPVALTTAEFDLLLLLARRAGRVVPREEILAESRGLAYDGLNRSVDNRVSRLRRKLDDDGGEAGRPSRIVSVWGVGYMLAVAPR